MSDPNIFGTPPPPPSSDRSNKDLGDIGNKTVKQLAEEASPHAIAELFRIGMGYYKDVNESTRVNALREVLDRGMGKPTQTTEVSLDADKFIKQLSQATPGAHAIDITPGGEDERD